MIRRVSEQTKRMTGGAVMSLLAGAALSIACSHPAAPSGVAPLGDLANAAAATAPGGAQERGFTPADLVARGWICVTPPAPNRILCSHPNQGFPVVGNPPPDDRPASYSLWAFDGSGNFIGPYTLLRTDLYQGQLCDGTGEPWVFRALAGYYECIHAVGR